MMKIRYLIFLLCTSLIACGQAREKVLIAAASDLKFALDSIVTVFKRAHTGSQIDVTYGSSGKLYEQVSHGAPFDLFFSADISYPLGLQKKGLALSDVETYGVGRIVIWCKKVDPNPTGMETLLNHSIIKVAIANPRHAPYGQRAEEAMKYFKVYEKIKSKLVFGENISQAAQFVTTGAADAGVIALSLALSPTMKKMNGSYYLIPATSHEPLRQGFVLLKHAKDNALAHAFKNFLTTTESVKILGYFGFQSK
jgi:molybdate transport system substrate-binding protein